GAHARRPPCGHARLHLQREERRRPLRPLPRDAHARGLRRKASGAPRRLRAAALSWGASEADVLRTRMVRATLWRVEAPIDREDVLSIMRWLMRLDAKADRILELLGDEEEENEADA